MDDVLYYGVNWRVISMFNCFGIVFFIVSRVVFLRGYNLVVLFQLIKVKFKVMEFIFILGKKKLFEVFIQI